jgi:hypothetical protein
LEVYAMMKCPKCGWLWSVQQAIFEAHEYYQKLPRDETAVSSKFPPITSDEAKAHRAWLKETKNPLETILEGPRPDRTE